jgi:tetratricopeptide (TPR) repeat protein
MIQFERIGMVCEGRSCGDIRRETDDAPYALEIRAGFPLQRMIFSAVFVLLLAALLRVWAIAQTADTLSPDIAAKFTAAVEAQKAGQLEAAADDYRAVLSSYPKFAPALLNLGLVEFAEHHPDQALPLLNKAKALDPNSQPAWLFAGLSAYQMNDFAAAEQPLQKAVALRPDDAKALLFLGQTYNALGKYRDAEDVLQKSVSIESKNTEIMYSLSQTYLHLALETSELLRETDPHNVRVYQMAGQMYAENQNFSAAIQEFKELVRRYPALPGGHGMLGKVYESMGNNADALVAYKQEISIDPFNAEIYARAGELSMENGDQRNGIIYLKRALQLDSTSEIAEVAYGKYLVHQKQTKDALGILKQAATLHGENKNVHFLLAQAYSESGDAQAADHERAIFEKLNREQQSQKEKGPAAFVDVEGNQVEH